jgi:biotin carboxylase
VIRSREDLAAAGAAMRRDRAPARTFVLEEFVDGAEWAVDGVVFDGTLQFLSVAAYSQPCLTVVSSGSVMRIENLDPAGSAAAYDLVRPTVETALGALRLRSGVFHMELFVPADGRPPVFGECAARPGGALLHEMVEYKFGVALGRAAVMTTAGIDPTITPSIRCETVGAVFLPSKPGVIVSYPTPAEVAALPGVEYVRLECPYGSRVDEHSANSSEGIGQVMLSGRTLEEFRDRCAFLTGWFDERVLAVPPEASRQSCASGRPHTGRTQKRVLRPMNTTGIAMLRHRGPSDGYLEATAMSRGR